MDSTQKAVNQRTLQDLKKRSTIGILFYMVLSVLLLVADGYYVKYPSFALVFFSLVSLICVLRLTHVIFFQKMAAWNPIFNKVLFTFFILMTSAIWGGGFAAFMMLEGELYHKLLMTICSAALCAGGVVAFLPNLLLAILFSALIVLPASFVLILNGVNLSLAIMMMMYFCYMLILTFRGNSEYQIALDNEIKLQKQSDTLRKLSRIDVLTGLFNRRYFNEVFEAEWKRASRDDRLCTVILGDIDHFKQVNDTFGHLAGDLYLKKISEILNSIFQRETDLVARYGGEEFVMLLPDSNTIQAFELAERVRLAVGSAIVEYQNRSINTTVSFGIASVVPDYKDSSVKLMRLVDDALYQAKQEGRNRIVIAQENREMFQ